MLNLTVNGKNLPVTSPQDTPLLYVLRDELGSTAPSSGAASRNAARVPSWSTVRRCDPASLPLPWRWVRKSPPSKDCPPAGQPGSRPTTGEPQTTSRAARLDRTTGPALRLLPKRHDDQGNRAPGAQAEPDGCEISEAFTTGGVSPRLCRCGTYIAIRDAVRHASKLMAKGEV